MDGVVVILGVGRIDRDKRQRAPILARRAQSNGPRVFGLFQGRGRKDMRNMVRLERDEADRSLGFHRTYSLDDARGRKAKPSLAQRLDGDEVAVLGFAGHASRHDKFTARGLLVDRNRTSRSIRRAAIDGEGARLHLVEDLDHAAGIGGRLKTGVGVKLDPHQNPRPHAWRGAAVAFHAGPAHENAGRRLVAVPFHGFRDQFAVSVFLGDVGDDKRRQAALDRQRLTAMRDSALGLQILDEELQFRFRFALHAEGAGNVALGDLSRRSLAIGRGRAANERDHLFARRQRGGFRLHGAVNGAC